MTTMTSSFEGVEEVISKTGVEEILLTPPNSVVILVTGCHRCHRSEAAVEVNSDAIFLLNFPVERGTPLY
jgi:hypothetical protein